jgi:hypothetical protein
MMILKKARQNKIYLVPGIISCIWIVFLILAGSLASHQTTFFDALSQTDVTSEYSAGIPPLRYLFEPVVGFTLAIANNVVDALVPLVLAYVTIRVVYLVIARVSSRENNKIKVLAAYARTFMNFYWKYCILAFLVGILVLLVGTILQGEIFFHTSFMAVVQASIIFWFVLLVLKLTKNAVIFFIPAARLGIKKPKAWTALTRQSRRYWNHKTWDVIGRESRYGLSVILIFAMVCLNLNSAQVPTQFIHTQLAENEILVDLHVHTTASDGWLSPEERVDWYLSQGIQAAAFSDHLNTMGASRAREYVRAFDLDFTVLTAQEFTSNVPEIHLNVYGIDEYLSPIEYQGQPYSPNCMNVSDMIKYVKDHDGYVTVNHYVPNASAPFTYTQLMNWGVDGFEIVGMGREKAPEIRQFCLDNNLTCVTGTDEHGNDGLDAFMRVTLADPANVTVDSIFAALKNNTHEAVLINFTPDKVHLPRSLREFGIVGDFLNYVLALDPLQVSSWICWSCGFFLAYLFIMHRIKTRFDAAAQERKLVEDPRKRSLLFKHPVAVLIIIVASCIAALLLLLPLVPRLALLD